GMRLFNILRDDFQNHGGQLILGPVVNGRIENGRAIAAADANGRVKEYAAETVILASGGFLNGGLIGEFDGLVRETVFNLDVDSRSGLLPHTPRQSWTSEIFLDAHAFSKFGVRVDTGLCPLDANGEPAAANLRAIGGLLAGADRLSEGSREGIALATAYRAIELIQ
ncbi:MAG: FAD-binding protein, partial [Chloroflexota bacterium]